MKFIFLLSFFSFVLLASCDEKSTDVDSLNVENLKEIEAPLHVDSTITNPLETRKLKLLITNHFNTYYLDHGNEKGLEYELLRLYLKEREIELELEVVHDLTDLHDSIIAKKAHMAAATFALPIDTLGPSKMSDYLYKTDIVLVRRESSPSLADSQKEIEAHLFLDGPFAESIIRNKKYNKKIKGIPAHEHASKQSLIEDVANKKIDYTICSRNEAEIMKIFYPNLNIDEVLYEAQPISFMVHPNCRAFMQDFNSWLDIQRPKSDFQWTIHKYHHVSKDLRVAMQHKTPNKIGSEISDFDNLVKKHAKNIDWDWRLMSALIYQESRFNPKCKSFAGALGLMQVMPATANAHARVSKAELFQPEKNMIAGTKFIDWMQKNFYDDENIDPINRQKFIIASYNVGPGHVQDAMKLCEKYDLDPNVWDDNVEKMVLAKSQAKYYRDPVVKYGYCRGIETVTYVRNVTRYFEHYSKYLDI